MTTDKFLDELRQCLPDPTVAVGPHDDLLATGGLDSLSFLDFTSAIERRFDVTLPDEVVFGQKFGTLSEIADAVRSLRGGA